MKTIWTGKVSKGKLKFDDPQGLSCYLAGLEGKEVEVIVQQRRKQRSLNQNNYYWLLVEILANYWGYWKDEAHEAIKWQFLRVEHEGKPPTVKSTTKLSTEEMNEFIENLKIWSMTEFNVFLPDADVVIEWGGDDN